MIQNKTLLLILAIAWLWSPFAHAEKKLVCKNKKLILHNCTGIEKAPRKAFCGKKAISKEKLVAFCNRPVK